MWADVHLEAANVKSARRVLARLEGVNLPSFHSFQLIAAG